MGPKRVYASTQAYSGLFRFLGPWGLQMLGSGFCKRSGCSPHTSRPLHPTAWPPFSTGALAGGVRGGGVEGADRA